MNKISIYLAGCETWYFKNNSHYFEEWRETVEQWFEKYCNDVVVINPCNYYGLDEIHHKSDAEIRRFDLHKVRHSDIVLVNLDHITDSVGTMNEIFVANELGIPVIGFYEFTNEKSNFYSDKYKEEPWILDAVHRIEDDETTAMFDACAYIRDYYAS